MSSEKNIHFQKLNESEKSSKLQNLATGITSSKKITVWIKGSDQKYLFDVISFYKTRNEVSVQINDFNEELLSQFLLTNFEINGVHFFAKAKIVARENQPLCISFYDEIYKSERRENFRLLTYPHHKVYVSIFVGKDEIDQSNILDFQTKQNQTTLFNNFLEMVNSSDKIKEQVPENIDGYLRFRVIDISVTGLAFQYGKIEEKFFRSIPVETTSVIIDFNKTIIKIPRANMLYTIDKVNNSKQAVLHKCGMQFLDMDTNLDAQISSLIYSTLRRIESEFEGFIK